MLLLIGYIVPFVGTAQSALDTAYIHSFPDTMNLRMQWAYQGHDLRARHDQQSGALTYSPRYRPRVGIGGYLWKIGFNLLLPLPIVRDTNEKPLRRFDIQGTAFFRRWMFYVGYHRYQGFYLESPQAIDGAQRAEVFLGDLRTKKLQVAATRIIGRHRVSFRAPYNQGNRQNKSAGSWLFQGNTTFLGVRDTKDITVLRSAALTEQALSEVQMYALGGKFGYTANLIHRSWVFHVLALGGLEVQQIRYEQGGARDSFTAAPGFEIRSGFGYDGVRWYTGVYGMVDYQQFQAGNWQFRGTSGQIRWYVGVRLAEPQWLHRLKPRILNRL